jgi:hypothetical protein
MTGEWDVRVRRGDERLKESWRRLGKERRDGMGKGREERGEKKGQKRR